MNAYMSINLLVLKDGRPYNLNIPQAAQEFSEVYAVLEEFKKSVEQLEKNHIESQKQSAEAQVEPCPEASTKE